MNAPALLASGMLALSSQIIAIGILIRSSELLACWPHLRDGDFLGRQPAEVAGVTQRRTWRQTLAGFPVCLVVLVLRAVIALGCLLLPWDLPVMVGLLGAQTVLQAYFNRRFEDVCGSSDHLTLVCLAAQSVGSWPGASAALQALALGFIAFHTTLAYWVTGADKLLTPHWRDGRRLTQVFRESAVRFAPIGELFGRVPALARAATWGVIAWELLFPLSIFLPEPGQAFFLVGGVLFHGTLAFTGGLHGFFWAFMGTYPAFCFLQQCLATTRG